MILQPMAAALASAETSCSHVNWLGCSAYIWSRLLCGVLSNEACVVSGTGQVCAPRTTSAHVSHGILQQKTSATWIHDCSGDGRVSNMYFTVAGRGAHSVESTEGRCFA